ncbi:MAG TPA: alpha/beta hydrolase-fold protein, partial [Gemmatimonadaceae bacterium]
YRTIADARHRAVAGLSMGGYGAVYLPLARPDLFSAGASLSGAGLALLRVDGTDSTDGREATSIEELHDAFARQWDATKAELGTDISVWRAYDPITIAEVSVRDHHPIPALWLVVGTSDESTIGVNRAFDHTLARLKIPHTYIEAPGGHNGYFWRQHDAAALVWLASQIAR